MTTAIHQHDIEQIWKELKPGRTIPQLIQCTEEDHCFTAMCRGYLQRKAASFLSDPMASGMNPSGDSVRVTKIFTFEMAHALHNYEGACRNIHGHSYILHVTIIGAPANNRDHPSDGLVMDFRDLKKIVTKAVIDRFDHALVLNANIPESLLADLRSYSDKILTVPFQPSCENILLEIKNILLHHFEPGVLHGLKLYETATSFCEWYRSDNF